MCGIVGYIGKNNATPILVEGLSRLEYRGYDSAGIAVVSDGNVWYSKTKGRVSDLEKLIEGNGFVGNLGIAHTRWATHGEPSDINAHPHTDARKMVYVVHNGIIENYRSIKAELENEGVVFESQTDTEVLAQLIGKYYAEQKEQRSLYEAVRKALKVVTGAYGIAVVAKDSNELVAAKLGSPLVVGIGDGEHVVASDVTAILPVTREIMYLEDGDIVVIKDGKLRVTDLDLRHNHRTTETVEWSEDAAAKGGYEHFMLKEINEQAGSVIDSLRGRVIEDAGLAKLGGLESVARQLQDVKQMHIVAMGTARHAGMVAEYMLEEYARIPVEVDFGAEFAYRQAVLPESTALLAISQSGETADTLLAVKEARRKGLITLGIVNVTASSIARTTDAGVYNHIGSEVAVASTKAFVSQVVVSALLTLYMGRMRDMSRATGIRIASELKALPDLVKKVLGQDEAVREIAQKYYQAKDMFFLGRKYNYPVALEGALKLKEVAYVHAEGYNAAEMKHGPIALIEPNFPVVIIAPKDSVYDKNISHIQELKARGAQVIAIATEGDEEIKKLVDNCIYIPKTLEMLTPVLSVIPLQLFSYYVAVARGCDVDKPRNLAKSVTVE